MKLVLEISNPQKLELLLELVRSLDFVEKVQVTNEPKASDAQAPVNLFTRFYGSAKTGMTIEEIDTQLEEMRSEWEHNI